MENPYRTLPQAAFWRPAVAERNMLEIGGLWTPSIGIGPDMPVATAGSCFAQHISRAMIAAGFDWIDTEPAPDTLPETLRRDHGYGVFSFRTGNIYTAAALRQWVEAAFGTVPADDELWEAGGRFHDPMRPGIEPGGFASAAEARALRAHTLAAMRAGLERARLFVFTLGLTEAWRNRDSGLVYAACPGTLAGEFLEGTHVFHNQRYPEILADMTAAMDLIRAHNPDIRFLLTVSPVPLVATAAGRHVLVSTTYSKSVLRAVAGDLAETRADTDYFPSYEIITAPPFRGSFFMPNQREVSRAGVDFVMRHFFAGLGINMPTPAAATTPAAEIADDDIRCEEALLGAFAP